MNTLDCAPSAEEFDNSYLVVDGIKNTISWSDIVADVGILPQYRTRAQSIIETRLGYLPCQNAITPYEPFLRAISYQYDHDRIDILKYDQEVTALVKEIRNKDLIPFDCPEFSAEQHAYYEQRKNTFSGLFVKKRLIHLLGYIPDLKVSLTAEIMIQKVVDEGIEVFRDLPNQTDIRAMTIILYREVLLEKDKQAANKSPLWYFDYADRNGYFGDNSDAAKIAMY